MRILVVEDNVEFYKGYFLRILGNLVPTEKIEFEHADTLEKGLLNLCLPWDMIVLDHAFPKNARFPIDDPRGRIVKNGADLAEIRRKLEADPNNNLKPTVIMAISSTQVGNREIAAKSGDATLCYLKLQVPEMAKAINVAMGAP
jgi:CheY-like chemotaxis protein